MTVDDLKELFYLDKVIDFENERLDDLRAKLNLHSPVISDMPKASGAKDKIGDITPLIVDEARKIEGEIRELEDRKRRLTEYIRKLPNIRVRIIMSLRYIDQMPWADVAAKIGGRETEDSVKKTCYRYFEQQQDKQKQK